MPTDSEPVMVRRAIPELHLWPGDHICRAEDGSLQVVRKLPASAAAVLAIAARRGDVRQEDETT